MNEPKPLKPKPLGAKNQDAKTWAMILHLSQLATYMIPIAGIVAPILIWQLKKDEFPEIDAHGKSVVNWIVSGTVLYFICIPLIFVFGLGLVLMLALMIAHIVFGIIGGLKANDGILWPYPMTFIKIF